MGESSTKLKHILEDLKSSWYFRVWAILWLVCAIVSFVTLILFASRSENSTKDGVVRLWTQTVDSMTFPKFHFRGFYGNLLNYSCTHEGNAVKTMNCYQHTNTSTCFAVDGPSVTATPPPANFYRKSGTHSFKDFGKNMIDCSFTVNVTGFQDSHTPQLSTVLWGWDLDGKNARETLVGPLAETPLSFLPNSWVWITLNKRVSNYDSVTWEQDFLYRDFFVEPADPTELTFNTSVLITDFSIFNTATVTQEGWVTVALVGGFSFFTYILHALVMFVVGFFLTNNSHFLGGGDHHSGGGSYQAVH